MSDKKIPLSLKITTATTLPLIALTVAGLFLRKCYKNIIADLDYNDTSKGLINNVVEKYPTKRAVVQATKSNRPSLQHVNQHTCG